MPVVKSLENICLDALLKGCSKDEFFEEKDRKKMSMFNFINSFITETCRNVCHFCECPIWQYGSKMDNFCDWRFFYKDMVTFSQELDELRWDRKIFKILDVFDLFFRIINY